MTLEGGWTTRRWYAGSSTSSAGVRADTGTPLTWVENHIYLVADGQITELWPAGGPQLS